MAEEKTVKRGRGRPAGSKNKKTLMEEKRTALSGGGSFSAEAADMAENLPYKTPEELHDKMAEYFELCKGAGGSGGWREVLEEFAELAERVREKPKLVSHEGNFWKIVGKLQSDGVFPDEAGMRTYLGLTHEVYKAYKDSPDFEAVFDWAQDMRESWAARRIANDPKASQAYLAILKQPGNGGWVDRRMDTGDKTLVVKTSGVGGVSAFK